MASTVQVSYTTASGTQILWNVDYIEGGSPQAISYIDQAQSFQLPSAKVVDKISVKLSCSAPVF